MQMHLFLLATQAVSASGFHLTPPVLLKNLYRSNELLYFSRRYRCGMNMQQGQQRREKSEGLLSHPTSKDMEHEEEEDKGWKNF